MPKSKSQRENSRAKSTSPTNFNKPASGKRIFYINIDQVNAKGLSKEYLNAPVSAWTSPRKLINSIQVENISKAGPEQALDHTRASLENIGNSNNVPDQLFIYAANCHRYSLSSKFSEEKEKSRILSSKAMDSASGVTDKTLDVLKEPTLREMDNGKT
ncbi:hypothetical protein BCV72DRAFT_41345 [Rhizopus microsporus var. microsporus]|uniref:Uncharacterized protein n=2 Tax=Rhizopus microsporus TaxID=58291 RepID=A0A2G4SSI1_RHIZD|nr:uncharacterized protein RHIMIDRAFT_18010 [Rhizopus microsporus ATCC 52813]ORE02869.1 hypothetical protein BCV72DRAFT_41345 [Rhizopus microsporus var. microsporus]PHZ11724.1 hypothetical protein RHIMIDRAFT_18010 [Rhizopus microsporus ATCC 52813]